MNGELLLSILIPSIPSRFTMMQKLVAKLELQVGDLPVEILVFSDNKKRSIGEKRDALVQLSKASHICFCDDDDDVNADYCSELTAAIRAHPDADVISFDQQVFLNNRQPFIVRFGLGHENQQVQSNDESASRVITRKPFHVCAWKRVLAQKYRFEPIQYAEDWRWVEQLIREAKTEHHVDRILHIYRFSDAITEAK